MQILTYKDRTRIEFYLSAHQIPSQIAQLLKKDKSVLSRELDRNGRKGKPYSADYAQAAYERRKHRASFKKLESDKVLRDYVVDMLKGDLSPDEISGRLKEHPELVPLEVQGKEISHEAIYQYIYAESNKQLKLWRYLRKHHSKRKPHNNRSKYKKSTVPNRVSIHQRPDVVNKRQRVGDWETDSVVGSGKCVLSVQRERITQVTKIHRIRDKTATATFEAICDSVEQYPKEVWKTLTFDNGTENYEHEKLKDWYMIETYFCDPYKSYQKGSVENTNGLIRQYIHKGSSIDDLTDEQIQAIEDKLNNRPRKKLGYLTPNEAMNQALKELQLI